MQYLMLFHSNNGHMKVPQCYVIAPSLSFYIQCYLWNVIVPCVVQYGFCCST